MAADRGKFICQSQSLNLWQEEPTYNSLTSMHFYTWKIGLKTGIYYFRTKPAANAIKYSVENKQNNSSKNNEFEECINCSA